MLDLNSAPPGQASLVMVPEPPIHIPESQRAEPPGPPGGKGLRPLSTSVFVLLVALAGVASVLFWPKQGRPQSYVTYLRPPGVVAQPRVQWTRALNREGSFQAMGDADRVVLAGLVVGEGDSVARTLELTGYSRTSGNENWSWTTELDSPESPPSVALEAGHVVLLAEGGGVTVVDADDGQVVWSREPAERAAAILREQRAILIVSAEPAELEVIDLFTGQTRWNRSEATVLEVTGELIFLYEGDDIVVTHAATGEVRRRYADPRQNDESLAPLANGDLLMVRPDAVARVGGGGTGKPWDANPVVGTLQQVWLVGDVIQLIGPEGWAGVDRANGEELWARSGQALGAEGAYALMDRQGELAVYDTRNGDELGHLRMSPEAEGTDRDLTAASDVLYVTEGGLMTAYGLPALTRLWQMEVASADAPYRVVPIERGVVVLQGNQMQFLA